MNIKERIEYLLQKYENLPPIYIQHPELSSPGPLCLCIC